MAGRPKEDDPVKQRTVYLRESVWARLEELAKSDGDRPLARFVALRIDDGIAVFEKERGLERPVDSV